MALWKCRFSCVVGRGDPIANNQAAVSVRFSFRQPRQLTRRDPTHSTLFTTMGVGEVYTARLAGLAKNRCALSSHCFPSTAKVVRMRSPHRLSVWSMAPLPLWHLAFG